ncbi:MAG: translation elongation factor Ts [Candidatus Calescibacterium sp.]|jgi:elongation factor Ts|nr:translation elongation factor Ts [Candidatus Calescibacterium sp.]
MQQREDLMEKVKELKEITGAGFADCRKALAEANGDIEKAIEILRKRGLAKAEKKLARQAKEGIVDAYIHIGGRIGVLVEVNCETDFVARNEEFKKFVHEIAMQIAAMSPRWIKREDVPEEIVKREFEIYFEQSKAEGKPDHIAEKIAKGKLEKFFEENCLYEQIWIKDGKSKIEDLIKSMIAKFGENISVRRFARFEIGKE